MQKPKVTIQMIADKAHVSKSLVSRILNGKEVRVSSQKRALVLKVANNLGYSPSKSTITNTRNKKFIALIQPGFDFDLIIRMTNAITAKINEHGYSLLIFNSCENTAIERQYLEFCVNANLGGIILNPCNTVDNTDIYESLNTSNFPLVFIDRYIDEPKYSFVTSKNSDAMFNLTEYLINRGHQRLLSIVQDKSTLTNVSRERLKGYYSAMDKYGLTGHNEIIYADRYYQWQPLYALLTSARRFSAFLLNTSWDMRYFYDLINRTDYAEKGDFEVAIFDDFTMPYTEFLQNKNNALINNIRYIIEQEPEKMGEMAVDIIINEIKKGPYIEPRQIFHDCVVREI